MHVAEGRWNHNIHHHPLVLGAIPPGTQRALDVGCGEGILARELALRIPHVVGIDPDAASIAQARANPGPPVEYVLGDVLTHPLEPFDLVASVATLHHLGDTGGLRRMRALVAPGGRLVIVGLARPRYPADLPQVAAGSVATRWHQRRVGLWQHSAPVVWPPPLTYAQTRDLVRRELPGARYRRHVLWRWSVIWTAP